MRCASIALGVGIVVTAAAACYVGPIEKDSSGTKTDQSPTDPEGDDGDGSGKKDAGPKATGLPCDIDELLEKKCRSCHGANPKAPMALVTYDDLVAMSPSDDTQTNAELSLARMKSTDDPMPPKGTKATSTELKAFAKWIADDYPRGTCGQDTDTGEEQSSTTTKKDAGTTTKSDAGTTKSDAGTTTPDAGTTTTSVCTSGVTWASTEESTKMNPGKACITCHKAIAGKPLLQVGGTIYPTSHEPDKCYGVQGVSVVITDATSRKLTLTSGATGNFTLSTAAQALTFPINVKVVKNGIERAMVKAAPHGDCNACHTEAGSNGAPGRIQAP